jgi:ethanolamine utilization protein EutN
MRIAHVVGKVTLSRAHPTFAGATLKLVLPLTWNELCGQPPSGESVVVWDELGAGPGCRIAISEGAEAAQPFFPQLKPVDCYNAAILDQVEVEPPDLAG